MDWSQFIAVNGATAHPHYDPDGMVYNMGNSYGPKGQTQQDEPCTLHVFTFSLTNIICSPSCTGHAMLLCEPLTCLIIGLGKTLCKECGRS